MTETKFELGKHYKGNIKVSYDENGKMVLDIIGQAIEELPSVEEAEKILGKEEAERIRRMVRGEEPISFDKKLQPGDVLTDKEGREWEVADLSEDPESIGWLYLKPKPKRLMGSIRIYRDTNGYDIYVGERATAVRDDWTHIATIKLSDFEEGYGL